MALSYFSRSPRSQHAVKHTQFPTKCCFSFYLSTVINQRQADWHSPLSMCLQPVPHSLKAHQQPQSLSCPGQPCDNTVNNSNVWREGATGAATVRVSKWGQGLLTSGDVAENPLHFSLLKVHLFSFLPLLSSVNSVGGREIIKKKKPWRSCAGLNCLLSPRALGKTLVLF